MAKSEQGSRGFFPAPPPRQVVPQRARVRGRSRYPLTCIRRRHRNTSRSTESEAWWCLPVSLRRKEAAGEAGIIGTIDRTARSFSIGWKSGGPASHLDLICKFYNILHCTVLPFLDDARPPPTDPLGDASRRRRGARLVRSPRGEAGQRQGSTTTTYCKSTAHSNSFGPASSTLL
eukprot:1182608-Prorocentrum_minimum.AAC.9